MINSDTSPQSRTNLLFITLMVAIMLAACSKMSTKQIQSPTSTGPETVHSDVFIDEQSAIDIASKLASVGDGHISGSTTSPQYIQSFLAPLSTTRVRLASEGWTINLPDTSNKMVWSVIMQGTWNLTGGPPPSLSPTPTILRPLFTRLLIIINAQTSEVLLTVPKKN